MVGCHDDCNISHTSSERPVVCSRLRKAAIQLVSAFSTMDEPSEGRRGGILSSRSVAEKLDDLLTVLARLGTMTGPSTLALLTRQSPDRSLSFVRSWEVEQPEDIGIGSTCSNSEETRPSQSSLGRDTWLHTWVVGCLSVTQFHFMK